MQTLEGRTVLVTGCMGNIGRALLSELAAAKMNIILCSHGPHKGDDSHKDDGHQRIDPLTVLTEELSVKYDGKYVAIKPVVEDEEDVAAKFAEAAEAMGGIDCIVLMHGRSAEYKEQNFETLDTDYVAKTLTNHAAYSYMGVRQALPYLEKSKAGRIVLFSNTEALSGGNVNAMAVSMAKGAVVSLTYSAARRLGPKGITVNCIAIGGIMNVPPSPDRGQAKTVPNKGFGPANWILDDEIYDTNSIPMGRLGTEADVIGAVSYLLSEEAGYVTGAVINVSGGLHMG